MNHIITFLHKQSYLIVTIIFAIFYFPIHPVMPTNGLDPSFLMVLAYGLSKNFKFGQDIIFTYGPLGFAYQSVYYSGIFHWAFIYWILILTGFALTIKVSLNKYSLLTQLSVLFPLLLTRGLDSFLIFILFMVVIIAPTIATNWWQSAFIAAILGFIGLSKFTFFIGGLIAILPLSITCMLKQQDIIKQLSWFTYFVAFILGWLLLGQEFNGIPAFLINSWYIASGYSSSMEYTGPSSEMVLGTIILSILAFQIIVRFSYQNKPGDAIEDKLITIVQIFSLLFISWLAFKQGFVRHDGHVLAFVFFSGAALGVIFLTDSQSETRFNNGIVYSAIILWFLFYSETNHYVGTQTIWQRVYQHVINRWNTLHSNGINFSIMENIFSNALNAIKLNHPLPKVEGTVDITTDISRVLGNGLNWRPRPVIQSYSVYTPELAALNGQHIASSTTAPQHFFVEIGAIDGRMAMQEDPLLWPQLLANYKFEATDKVLQGNILHLGRNPSVDKFIQQDFTLTEKDGYWILPSNIQYNFLTLSAMPKLSVLDKAIAFLFKPREIFIESILANGEKKKHKFIQSLKDTSFIFSPLVENKIDFISIRYPQFFSNSKQVVAFRFIDANKNIVLSAAAPKIKTYKIVDTELNTSKTIPSEIYHLLAPEMILNDLKISAANTCIGNLEDINGNIKPKQFSISNTLNISGWLAQSPTQVLPAAQSAIVVLTDSKGKNLLFRTQKVDRPDVGTYYKNVALNAAGFSATINVSLMTGEDYTLGLGFIEGETIKLCPQFKIHGIINK